MANSTFSEQRFATVFVTRAAAVIASLATLAGPAGSAAGDNHFVGASHVSTASSGGSDGGIATEAATTRPNVVIVLVDDLDTGSLNRMLSIGMMPKLKSKVIDQGTQFTNYFVTTAFCSPSRATLLTGQYSHNHHVRTNGRPLGGVVRFDDSSSLATWLQKAGYRTGLVGKYLNNYGNNKDPTTPVDDVGYIPPGWNDWQGLMDQNTDGLRAQQQYNYTINVNGRLVKHGTAASQYQTDVIGRSARQFVDQSEKINDAQPFFLLVTPTAPHLEQPRPLLSGCTNPAWNESIRAAPRHIGTLPAGIQLPRPPNFNEADLGDKPSWFQSIPRLNTEDIGCLNRRYRDRLTALRAVDDLVGGLVDALVTDGEWANTVFIFTSDNGFFYGEHRLTDKVLGYEESIRLPLYIHAPGFPPQVTTRAALNNDLAPTVAQFAGISPGLPVDGRSLLPLLRNPEESNWRKRFLVEYLGTVQTNLAPPRVPFGAVRTTDLSRATPPDQFYVEYNDGLGSIEFYDLASDAYEISSQHANAAFGSVRNVLASWLSQFRNCHGGTCQTVEDQ
jgi:arylsulfatase A-like enzyme